MAIGIIDALEQVTVQQDKGKCCPSFVGRFDEDSSLLQEIPAVVELSQTVCDGHVLSLGIQPRIFECNGCLGPDNFEQVDLIGIVSIRIIGLDRNHADHSVT